MTAQPSLDVDPFEDPSITSSISQEQHDLQDEITLTVGRNASLTLGTDSLIVLDEGFNRRAATKCCGLIASKPKNTRAIPYFNVVWAELSDLEITIHYAHPTSKHVVAVACVQYEVEKLERPTVTAWISKLLDRAYGESQRQKRIKVLINPFGGQGNAPKWYTRDIEPIFAAAQCEMDVERTRFKGHAVEIAANIDVDAYDVIASCSGDGLPHEAFNGLGMKQDARRALAKVAVVQLPCGSGNAMSWNLNGTDSPSMAALCIVKGIRTPLDLISITQGDKRTLSFCSQSVGMVAEVDLGTDHLRWMGDVRFTYGFFVRLLRQTIWPCDVAIKVEIASKPEIREHYRKELSNHASFKDRRGVEGDDDSSYDHNGKGLPILRYGSINDNLPQDWNLMPYNNMGNFYAGNMAYMAADTNFFTAALPNDGNLDLVTMDGDVSRISAIQSLLAVDKGTFFDMPAVTYRKISGYRIIPKGQKDGYISIDGERVPFEPYQAEVHRGLGTVLSRSGHIYEAKGVAYSDSA